MNKTNIDWPHLDFTWNPVVGCKHGCTYCYAKEVNNRYGIIPEWTEPVFFENRLPEPYKRKKPATIFVGSMCDLFGKWIDSEWILKVIKVTEDNPQHTFMFLTKNPLRYFSFAFPENCWLGATIDYARYEWRIDDLWLCKAHNKTFVSVEPLLSGMQNVNFDPVDLVIVGAQTGKGATPPPKDWIYSIKHRNIYYKENIKKYLK